ncbi:MAG: DinB family protein [Acidimicrobiia bacterium]|nr:DinB family protein [Acidimicrobiia bacterium]
MKRSTWVVIACALAVTMADPAAQRVTLSTDLIKDWRAQQETMMRLADAMPESAFGFKPTPPQRSFGEQVLHVAGANIMLMKFLGGKTSAPPIVDKDLSIFGLKATSKADILQALQQSYTFGDAVLREFPDDALVQTVQGPPWIGEATRAKMVYFTMGHALDIYGQMVVYLRLNGVVPPASRRGGV